MDGSNVTSWSLLVLIFYSSWTLARSVDLVWFPFPIVFGFLLCLRFFMFSMFFISKYPTPVIGFDCQRWLLLKTHQYGTVLGMAVPGCISIDYYLNSTTYQVRFLPSSSSYRNVLKALIMRQFYRSGLLLFSLWFLFSSHGISFNKLISTKVIA